jgi:SAM-dependent methyltransferase
MRRLEWAARAVVRRALVLIRRRYYVDGSAAPVIERLPRRWLLRLGLDDGSARGSRRIEIGAGPYPQPGYLHVDVDPHAAHLEARAPAWDLPFPDGWATEILSIHALEHIPPRRLRETLREWYRVLRPGGLVQIHVPNSPALMEAYLTAETASEKWMLSGALLGMYCGPEVRGPEDLSVPSDHQILFDRSLLLGSLEEAGFAHVADLTEQVTDRHTAPWRDAVDRYSIVAQGRRPA